MKKIALAVLLFAFAMLAWKAMADGADFAFNAGDEGGAPGALAALLLAGGALAIALVALLFTGMLLALVFAGVGVVLTAACALAVAAALSPLLLSLLLPLAVLWLVFGRARKDRAPGR